MSIRIIEDGHEITLTRSEHDRLHQEWRENCKYSARPIFFEEWVRARLKPKQLIGLPVIDPDLLDTSKEAGK